MTKMSLDTKTKKLFVTSLSRGSIHVINVEDDVVRMDVWMDGLVHPYAIHASRTSGYICGY